MRNVIQNDFISKMKVMIEVNCLTADRPYKDVIPLTLKLTFVEL